jgi:hypothetical protein
MNRDYFNNLCLEATGNVLAFAKFVQLSEFLFSDSTDAAAVKLFRSAWFEVEIVNAIALAAWEEDGRPVGWDDKWRTLYQASAAEAVIALKAAVNGL